MHILLQWKYRGLFFSLLLSVVVLTVFSNNSVGTPLLLLYLSIIFLISLMIFITDRSYRIIAVFIGLPTLVGMWAGLFIPGIPQLHQAVVLHLLAALFFGFTIGGILRDIHREKGITTDSVYGAFCGYFMVGLAFGHLFEVIELLHPNSLRGEGLSSATTDARMHILLTYFSFITLTTVGYGDITPNSDTVRGLVMLEAIVGQFYIAVLIADLIGKRVGQAMRPPEAGTAPGSSLQKPNEQ